ncbi:MAG: amidohydrolase family protein [Chloroflexota bacterium]
MDLELIISGGDVIDGSAGAVPVRADIGVAGGRIVAVGDLSGREAPERIDATGRVVTPGFIDAHVHSELALLQGDDTDRFGSLIQGVTSHATGADGFGWQPMVEGRDTRSLWRSTTFAYGSRDHLPDGPAATDYLRAFEGKTPVNLLPFAPHQAIRFAAKGWAPGVADEAEMAIQQRALRDWLDAGAFGMATGLDYQPAASTRTDEIVALARTVAETGGVYAPHMRYAQVGRDRAYDESIEIGRRAGLPVTIAHETIDDVSQPRIEAARADGVEVSIDWYCYPAGCTHLLAMLQPEDYEGGTDGVLERIKDPAARARFGQAIEHALVHPEDSDAFDGPEPQGRAYFSATRTGRYVGMAIPEIAAAEGISVAEAAARLMEQELPDAVMVYRRGVSDADFDDQVRRTITHPAWTLTSDGLYHGPLPHPRGYGTYVRFLRYAVRDLKALSFGEAIHRMSGGVADRLRIADRGRVREGLAADLVVLDPATVAETNDWDHPRRPPVGVDAVLVNGTVVVRSGVATGTLAGRVLRRS